jgi:DNA-binding MarR family transcriptional regulator
LKREERRKIIPQRIKPRKAKTTAKAMSQRIRPSGTLYLVKRLEQVIRQRLDAVLANFDLTASQYTALTVLRAKPGLSSAELARRSFVTAQSMNEMVAALGRKGLMARVPSSDDRRVQHLRLLPKSVEVLAACDAVVHSIEMTMAEALGADAYKNFHAMLHAALASLAAPPARDSESDARPALAETRRRRR